MFFVACFNKLCQKSYTSLGSTEVGCGRYVITLGGASPSRALVRRTVREGKGVHREMESEESRIQNADLTNRKPGNRRRI
jgi:hypothetical protein